MRKGWFIVPGRQRGDRTLDDQMLGITPALAEAPGKTVLDLGCAEGLVGREFAKAGAVDVHGIDVVREHIDTARELCAAFPQMRFDVMHLDNFAGEREYDIVLALGVAHKLHEPERFIRYVAHSARQLAIIRLSGRANGSLMHSKQDYGVPTVDVAATMRREGFALDRTLDGPRGERVMYWRPC